MTTYYSCTQMDLLANTRVILHWDRVSSIRRIQITKHILIIPLIVENFVNWVLLKDSRSNYAYSRLSYLIRSDFEGGVDFSHTKSAATHSLGFHFKHFGREEFDGGRTWSWQG